MVANDTSFNSSSPTTFLYSYTFATYGPLKIEYPFNKLIIFVVSQKHVNKAKPVIHHTRAG